jgi:hypothetical protein
MAEKLKPFGLPADPLKIIRCQYKYSHPNQDYHILVDFELKFENDNDEVVLNSCKIS